MLSGAIFDAAMLFSGASLESAATSVVTKTIARAGSKVATNGGKYAFGLKHEVVGFADEIGTSHLIKDPNWKGSFLDIINNSKNELHFTLKGIDETPMQMILKPGRSGINWEMNALYNSPAFENTIFHYGGNTYKGVEVFKIKP